VAPWGPGQGEGTFIRCHTSRETGVFYPPPSSGLHVSPAKSRHIMAQLMFRMEAMGEHAEKNN